MKVIVFGNVPLATWVVEKLINEDKIELLGVVCEFYDENAFSHHRLDFPSTYHFCKKNNIRILSMSEAAELAKRYEVFGISVRFNKIFKADFLALFNPGIVNLHGGELPRYRGTNIANHAVLEGAKHGAGTIHFLDKGIDTGDIVIREFFEVDSEITAFEFFGEILFSLQLGFEKLLKIIKEDGTIPKITQDSLIKKGEVAKTYRKANLVGLNKIESFDDLSSVAAKVKAFYFPGHEPAFFEFDGRRYFIHPEFTKCIQ